MTSRLLGLAFAAADLLVELDAEGRVGFVVGAAPRAGMDVMRAWAGSRLADQLAPMERSKLTRLLADLGPGKRSAPLEVLVLAGDGMARTARISVFRLPDLDPAISCAINWIGEAVAWSAAPPPPLLTSEGLVDRTRALMQAPGAAPLAIDFVDLPGLDLADEAHRRAAANIETLLQLASIDGASAARLSPERFAVVRDEQDRTDLSQGIRDAGQAEGVELDVEMVRARPEIGAAAEVTVRALRLALENCLKDGVGAAGAGFTQSLSETMRDAERFRAVVRERQFSLKYQPIVDLKTRALHHFEALARFTGGSSGPASTIRMAEELGLIEGFDFVVAEKAIGQLRRPGRSQTHIAINVSGASLAGDAYVEHLLRLTSTEQKLRKQLMVEVTETAALADLESADRRLKALRAAGIKVCLDDFGVGAASFDYVGRLSLDVVKIDGHFMQDIVGNDRSRTLIGHLVKLCADLKLETVAEMVETEAQAEAVRALGVGYGQGWLFGKPQDEPVMSQPGGDGPALARRRGAVEAWG